MEVFKDEQTWIQFKRKNGITRSPSDDTDDGVTNSSGCRRPADQEEGVEGNDDSRVHLEASEVEKQIIDQLEKSCLDQTDGFQEQTDGAWKTLNSVASKPFQN